MHCDFGLFIIISSYLIVIGLWTPGFAASDNGFLMLRSSKSRSPKLDALSDGVSGHLTASID